MEIRGSAKIGLVCVGAAAAAALFVAASLAACGSSGGSPATPQAITITPAAKTGTTTEAVVGDTVTVLLEANVTTGFTWSFSPGDTMEMVSSKYVPDPNPSGLAGAGGVQYVTVKVTKAGTSDLTGTYRQQWNSPSPDAQPDFSMTIVSTD